MSSGMILQYSSELDDYGQCKFRVSTRDTLFDTYGDILAPHKYWVQLVRGGTIVWQGPIIENVKRSKDYIEIVAVEPLWYLSKILVNRSSSDPSGLGQNDIYRIFSSGTMADAVTAIMGETITTYQSNDAAHALSGMTLGTIQNPNYPPNMTDGNTPTKDLTGAWYFGDGISAPLLQFDFTFILTILQTFGVYTYSDFYLDNDLVFNFVPFKGDNLINKISFNWGGKNSPSTNIVDYNVPRLGQRMANHLFGIATDPTGKILHFDQIDNDSIDEYGYIQDVEAFSDLKDQATLNARLEAEIPLISSPDNSAVSVTLDERGYPLGQYNVGDIVYIRIDDTAIDLNDYRRIVGYTVSVNNTGREITVVQTNKVLPWQYASLGSIQ